VNMNLDTSDWRLWVMCLVIVVSLAAWLIAIFMAARHPSFRNPRTAIKGPVQGGRHVAVGGRSVSPGRDPLADSPDESNTSESNTSESNTGESIARVDVPAQAKAQEDSECLPPPRCAGLERSQAQSPPLWSWVACSPADHVMYYAPRMKRR